ncbi:MAG: BatD family protein [Bacteroidota bacterium]
MKKSYVIVLFVSVVLAICPLHSFAQKLSASASATSMGANNSIQVTYTLTGGQSQAFQPPSFAGFSASGPYQSSSSNISYDQQGKTKMETTMSWIYTLVPTKIGKVTIDPAKTKVNGNWISSGSVTINVSQAAAGSATNKQPSTQTQTQTNDILSGDLYVKAVADKTTAMQGEQITLTYKVYFKVPVAQIGVKKLPSFSGFWSTELRKADDKIKQYNETVGGQKYMVAEMRKVALFPQKTGKLTVDPIEVECVAQIQVKTKANNPFSGFFNDPFFNDPFFQNQFSVGYKQVLKNIKSNSLTFNITDLPSANKPVDFSGFVGSLAMDTKVDKREVKANEAINLSITLTGKGNLSLLDKLNVEFPPDFEVYDPQISDDISIATGEVAGTKTFNYLILPRTPGNFKLKPITLSYFDKNKKVYVTLSSGEIDIKVAKGDGTSANTTNTSNKEDIKYIGSDIKFIDNHTFEVYPTGNYFFASLWYYLLIFAPIALFMLFIILMRRRIKLHSNVVLLKHKRATKIALRRLKQANSFLKAEDKNNFYVELSRALWGYISDKFSIPLVNLSLDSAQYTLAEKNISENIRNKFLELLNNCEFARFAPAEASVSMLAIYKDAIDIISQTEQELK